MNDVWEIMSDYLYFVSHHYQLKIYAFVLMSNHFHLLASTPEINLSEILNYFMRETSREIGRLSGRINQIYGARNHKTLLPSFHYYMNTYKYIYRNPVRAKICNDVVEYPYSTLHGLLGLRRMIIPMAEDTLLFKGELDESHLLWLNTPSIAEHEDEMRRALRRSVFKLPKTKDRRKSELETTLL
jgi:REP element-mobilizing transposase RayT